MTEVDYAKISDIEIQVVNKRPDEAAYQIYLLREEVKVLESKVDKLNEAISTIYDSGDITNPHVERVVRAALGLDDVYEECE